MSCVRNAQRVSLKIDTNLSNFAEPNFGPLDPASLGRDPDFDPSTSRWLAATCVRLNFRQSGYTLGGEIN